MTDGIIDPRDSLLYWSHDDDLDSPGTSYGRIGLCTLKDYYQILGVGEDASGDKVRQRYRFLAQAYHPDRFPSAENKAAAEAEFKSVQEAYAVLSNERRRADYDRSRRLEARPDRGAPRRTAPPGEARSGKRKRPMGERFLGWSLARWWIAGLLLLNLVLPDPFTFLDELIMLVLFLTIDKFLPEP